MNNTTSQKNFNGVTDSKFNTITATLRPSNIEEKKDEYFFQFHPLS